MTTQTSWPEKTDDFLPYASDPHSYWTGYYTSRPSSKLFMRQGELWSQIYNQMVVIKNIDISDDPESLERAVAVNQHHDAITGTEKQRVADNYHARLFTALEVILLNEYYFDAQTNIYVKRNPLKLSELILSWKLTRVASLSVHFSI